MFVCLDVAYEANTARAACVVFADWKAAKPVAQRVINLTDIAAYVPGEFYRRELPCLLAAIEPFQKGLTTIIVDSYVDLAPTRAGLGRKLFEALDQKIAVVGVAKTFFEGATHAREVRRGGSDRPLYITAAGMLLGDAANGVASMHGPHRIPTLLKLVDQLSRGNTRAK